MCPSVLWRALAGGCAALACQYAILCSTAKAGDPPATSVILISVDTLRADRLSIYGSRQARTPNIDSLADRGTLFREIASQIPLTLPSHVSLFTSTFPFSNRVEENAAQVPPNPVALASVLREHGYHTAAFIGAVYLERELGLDRGFDLYDSPFSFEAFSSLSGSMFFGDRSSNPFRGRDRRDGALVVRAALQWLRANRSQPVFAFVHLFDLHQPYRLPPSAARRPGLSPYDAELEYIDQVVGSFRDALQRDGWWDRSLVILLSDHGEGLGEHGEETHGYFIYQSTLRVPLLVHWPSGSSGYVRCASQPAALMDVAPTILDFLHLPAPPSFAGRSLLKGLNSGNPGDPAEVYGESLYSHDAFGWSALRSLRVGRYKYIAAPRPELYDLETDPGESRNVIARQPAEARSLEARLSNLLATHAPDRPTSGSVIPPARLAALQSLGYLAPGRQALKDSGPDPKDKLAEYRDYEQAQHEILSGRNNNAIAILRRLLERDPRNTLARRDIGVAYNAQACYDKARANLQQVLAVAPDDFVAQFELGLADEHLGLLPEALDHLRTACEMAPQSGGCRRELQALQQKMVDDF